MALVKTSTFAAGAKKAPQTKAAVARAPAPSENGAFPARSRQQAPARHAKASERLAAATEQLASGLAEASAAAEQLRRAMEQIATGGEEAAGASQEQLAAIRNIVGGLTTARDNGEQCRRRTEIGPVRAAGHRRPDHHLRAGDRAQQCPSAGLGAGDRRA